MSRFSPNKSGRRFYQPPKKTQLDNSPFEIEVTSLSHDGRGLARPSGKTLFIEGALPGERVRARYTQQKSKFDQARTLEVLSASPERAEPQCPHFDHCGGCQLQHLSAAAQIHHKQQQALNQLQRIGGVVPETILTPLEAEHWHYRRRARLGICKDQHSGKLSLGFRQQQSNQLVPIDQCPVLESRAEQLIPPLNEVLNQLQQSQVISHIEICLADTAAALVLRHPKPLIAADQQRLQTLADALEFDLYLQPGGPESLHLASGDARTLSYALPDLQLQLDFQPQDFTQINPQLNQQMIRRALELLAPGPDDRVLDLFCGLGNFTLPLARLAREVVGIEAVEAMVERGRTNAALNRLDNVHFYAADLSQPITDKSWFGRGFNKVLLDPPRAGAFELIEPLVKLGAQQILYISCDPATLARDAGELLKGGYRLTHWGVMNMFPHTTHVESIALFERQGRA
ncbi:MAG: 23S rRNA (uracil1939-C5)-methyltransferase [Motiliproteus sp.]|jgi:23S rRNA (uracil1939-C5)-methyltransferase